MAGIGEMALKIATVFCVYLVFSISTASAVELSIYQLASGAAEEIEMTLDASTVIDKDFEFVHDPASDPRYENVQVKIEVMGNDPLYPISKIYLFRCKDSSPLDCVDYEPVEADSFLSGERGTFYWTDISRGTKAGFLTLVKFSNNGKDSWVGYWDEATRTGVENFNHESHELSDLSVYAKPGIDPQWIRDYIEEYHMIPANWVERTVFGLVDGNPVSEIYELIGDSTEMDALSFGRYKPTGNTVETIVKDYMVAFAKGSVANPITFYLNDVPTCGDEECGVGEDPISCCVDCGCSIEGETCTSNTLNPYGLCHVCGDGTHDPVEDSNNCCVDAGCPETLYCSPEMNIPYGNCVSAHCGNGQCEPSEDSGTCAIDCWNTQGRTCADAFGNGYYYDQNKQTCVLAECGKNGCESGEDEASCCLDCGCSGGDYCDTGTVAAGVCTPPTCGNANCEPGEDYSNCCMDCNDCPLDPYIGQMQVCTNNVCHLCGNGHIESPVENPDTCCQDAGCINGYCSVSGQCRQETSMGLWVTILPSSIDCTQTDSNVDVKFTVVNGPAFIDSFTSVTYMYENGRYTLTNCQQQGESYICKMPLTGPETFQGCFDEGAKDLDFTVVMTYFDDTTGVASNDIRYAELEGELSFDVTKARIRSCNEDGSPDANAGESSETCCWDFMCDGGYVCTATGCAEENVISLSINPDDLPARHNIDCSSSGITSGADFTFRAHVENVPEHAQEMFTLLNWKLLYNGKTYTAQNIPGFTCSALTDTSGHHTGEVECSMPVSMFPACPDPPQPNDELFTLELNVLGGGLAAHYPIYEGKAISDTFSLDYVQGLPLCGDGNPNPELGEVMEPQVTCCQDTGCLNNEVCTINAGCVPRNMIDIDVTIDPSNIDCTPETDSDRPRQVIITASAPYKPYSPQTNGLEFGDAYLDDSRIGGELYGVCEPFVNSSSYSVYAWRCSIPVSEFSPFCWIEGEHDAIFDTTVAWFDNNDNRVTEDVSVPLNFNINAKTRTCVIGGGCQADQFGEVPGNVNDDPVGCCADCGCTGDAICTLENRCRSESDIDMSVEVTSPALNCMDASYESEDELVFEAEIANRPYDVRLIRWTMEYDGETFSEPHFSCDQVIDELTNEETWIYECTMPVWNFPGCGIGNDGDDHDVTLNAYMIYEDFNGPRDNTLKFSFPVTVEKVGLPQCGNGRCDSVLGETSANCCQDCPCSDDKVCLDAPMNEGGDRCHDGDDITIDILNDYLGVTASCELTPGQSVDIMSGEERKTRLGTWLRGRDFRTRIDGSLSDRYVIQDYGCFFNDPVEIEVRVSPKPYGAYLSSATYLWEPKSSITRDDDGSRYVVTGYEETSDGTWRLSLQLNQDGSYTFGPTTRKVTKGYATIKDLAMTIQSATLQGDQKVVTARSTEEIEVEINHKKSDDLLDYEEVLMDIQDAMKKSNRIVCLVTTLLATCVVCSLMAGGTSDEELSKTIKDGEKADTEKKSPEPSGEIRINLPKKEKAFGGIPMNMFSNMMNSMSGASSSASKTAGYMAAGVFIIAEMTITKCSGAYWGAIAGATAYCTYLTKTNAGMTKLRNVVKMCDTVASLMGLLQMITNMQSTMLTYQACVVSAKTALATRSTSQETGYDMGRRTYQHYNNMQQCQTTLNNGMDKLMKDLADYSYSLQQSQSWSDASVTMSPAVCDGSTNVGRPDSEFIATFNLPQTRTTTQSYGYATVELSYECYKNGKYQGTDIVRKSFPLRVGNNIRCDSKAYGLSCRDTISSTKRLDARDDCRGRENDEIKIGGKDSEVTISIENQVICTYKFDPEGKSTVTDEDGDKDAEDDTEDETETVTELEITEPTKTDFAIGDEVPIAGTIPEGCSDVELSVFDIAAQKNIPLTPQKTANSFTAEWDTTGLNAGDYTIILTCPTASKKATHKITLAAATTDDVDEEELEITSPRGGSSTVGGPIVIEGTVNEKCEEPYLTIEKDGKLVHKSEVLTVTDKKFTYEWKTEGYEAGDYDVKIYCVGVTADDPDTITYTLEPVAEEDEVQNPTFKIDSLSKEEYTNSDTIEITYDVTNPDKVPYVSVLKICDPKNPSSCWTLETPYASSNGIITSSIDLSTVNFGDPSELLDANDYVLKLELYNQDKSEPFPGTEFNFKIKDEDEISPGDTTVLLNKPTDNWDTYKVGEIVDITGTVSGCSPELTIKSLTTQKIGKKLTLAVLPDNSVSYPWDTGSDDALTGYITGYATAAADTYDIGLCCTSKCDHRYIILNPAVGSPIRTNRISSPTSSDDPFKIGEKITIEGTVTKDCEKSPTLVIWGGGNPGIQFRVHETVVSVDTNTGKFTYKWDTSAKLSDPGILEIWDTIKDQAIKTLPSYGLPIEGNYDIMLFCDEDISEGIGYTTMKLDGYTKEEYKPPETTKSDVTESSSEVSITCPKNNAVTGIPDTDGKMLFTFEVTGVENVNNLIYTMDDKQVGDITQSMLGTLDKSPSSLCTGYVAKIPVGPDNGIGFGSHTFEIAAWGTNVKLDSASLDFTLKKSYGVKLIKPAQTDVFTAGIDKEYHYEMMVNYPDEVKEIRRTIVRGDSGSATRTMSMDDFTELSNGNFKTEVSAMEPIKDSDSTYVLLFEVEYDDGSTVNIGSGRTVTIKPKASSSDTGHTTGKLLFPLPGDKVPIDGTLDTIFTGNVLTSVQLELEKNNDPEDKWVSDKFKVTDPDVEKMSKNVYKKELIVRDVTQDVGDYKLTAIIEDGVGDKIKEEVSIEVSETTYKNTVPEVKICNGEEDECECRERCTSCYGESCTSAALKDDYKLGNNEAFTVHLIFEPDNNDPKKSPVKRVETMICDIEHPETQCWSKTETIADFKNNWNSRTTISHYKWLTNIKKGVLGAMGEKILLGGGHGKMQAGNDYYFSIRPITEDGIPRGQRIVEFSVV